MNTSIKFRQLGHIEDNHIPIMEKWENFVNAEVRTYPQCNDDVVALLDPNHAVVNTY